MRKPALAVVTTPLQLLCLREAIRQAGIALGDVEVVGVFRRPRRAQSIEVGHRLGLQIDHEVVRRRWGAPRRLHRFLDYLIYRRVAPRLRGRELVFVGHFGDPEQWALALRAARSGLVPRFVDDGSASIALWERYEAAGMSPLPTPSPTGFFLTGRVGAPPAALFTFFPLEASGSLRVERNDLQTLREELARWTLPAPGEAVFVSQPLVELGLISDEDELVACLRSALKEHPGLQRKLYLKHPSESMAGARRRAGRLDMELVAASLPVEALLAWDLRPPELVLSIFSTALFSLSRIKLPGQRILMAVPPAHAFDAGRLSPFRQLLRLASRDPGIEQTGFVDEWLRSS